MEASLLRVNKIHLRFLHMSLQRAIGVFERRFLTGPRSSESEAVLRCQLVHSRIVFIDKVAECNLTDQIWVFCVNPIDLRPVTDLLGFYPGLPLIFPLLHPVFVVFSRLFGFLLIGLRLLPVLDGFLLLLLLLLFCYPFLCCIDLDLRQN